MERAAPALGILAIVISISLCGCGREAVTDAQEFAHVAEAGLIRPAKDTVLADLQHKRAELGSILVMSAAKIDIVSASDTPGTSGEVRRSISDALSIWDDHLAGLAAAPRLVRSVPEQNDGANATVSGAILSEETLAVGRKYAGDRLNLQMRIDLLESRLASAAEQDRKSLGKKIDQMKTALEAIDEAQRAEIESRLREANHKASAEDHGENVEANDTGVPDIEPEDYSIIRLLSDWRTGARQEQMAAPGIPHTNASIDDECRDRLVDVRESIDNAMSQIQRSQAGDSGERTSDH